MKYYSLLEKKINPLIRSRGLSKISKSQRFCGIESIRTHTMRKSFGYWFYKQTKDVAMLQEILNHSTPQITLKYIGINKEAKDNILDTFQI
ncbi:tyrosine-type recombinase/integrase [Bacillus paranthracis]|uniref:tyrosine-type recombinase/integrase n=1 Tax=Bacillus paranthracis TaxID=2026186 RepID=UPI003D648598